MLNALGKGWWGEGGDRERRAYAVDHYALAFFEVEGSVAILDGGVRDDVAVEANGCR